MVTYRENIVLRQFRIKRLCACSSPTKITTIATKPAPPTTSHKIALKSNLNNKILNSETTAYTLSTITTTTAENNCKKLKSHTKYCIMLTHKGSYMIANPVKIPSSASVVGAAFVAPRITSKTAVRTASTIPPSYKTVLRSLRIAKSPSAITSLQCRNSRTVNTTATTNGGVCIVGIRNNFTSNMQVKLHIRLKADGVHPSP
ncbi:hypothetical protein GQX74_015201 [Glossina fuscipes]|nr:hypothetical protein GQX74_015201 [Glossina fuscipes]